MSKSIAKFLSDSRGATGIEYGLIVGLVALVAAGAAPRLSSATASSLAAVNGAFSTSTASRFERPGAPETNSSRFVN